MRPWRAVPLVLAGAFLLLALPSASGQAETDSDITTKLYLKAATASADPHLTPDSVNPTTDSFTVASPQDSVLQTAGWAGGESADPITFGTKSPVGATRWLNLTKYVYVLLHYQPTANGAADVPGGDRIRVELYAGDRLVGGKDVYSYPHTVPSGWLSATVYFFPEVSSFLPTDQLAVKISRNAGLGELRIGTNGNHQSSLRYSYFDRDPLAGALFVENSNLISTGATTDDDGPGAGAALLILPAVALAGLVPLRRRTLVLLLVLSLSFSGCAGSKAKSNPDPTDGTGPPTNTVDVRKEHNETLERQGVGALQGWVRDGENAMVPIRDANVGIVATSRSERTDANGFFAFDNLTAKTYLIKVDAKGLQSAEREFLIEVGIRLTLNFTLFSGIEKASNFKAHVHDLWPEGQDDIELFSVDVPPSPAFIDATATGKTVATPAGGATWAPIPVPSGTLVLPGTVRIELTISWATEPGRPVNELGLRVTPPKGTPEMQYVGRGKGEAFNVVVFPNLADSGHQKFTRWSFQVVYPPVPGLNGAYAEPAYVASDVHVVARIHKGIVPYEPAHEDFWKGATEIQVMAPQGGGSWSLTGVSRPISPMGQFPYSSAWAPQKLVPPGTKEVRGNFSWSYLGAGPPDDAPFGKWTLAYMPANVNPQGGAWKHATLTPTGSPHTFTYVIPLEKGESDQFYQSASYWRFSPDMPDDDPLAPNAQVSYNPPGAGPQFRLDATAFCCASWEE